MTAAYHWWASLRNRASGKSKLTIDLFSELLGEEHWDLVFTELKDKAAESPARLHTSPVIKDLPLSWILREEKFIRKTLRREILNKRYFPFGAKLHDIILDRSRTLTSFSWPDRIVEMLMSKVLRKATEPYLTNSLYSYRTGFGNIRAAKELGAFVRQELTQNSEIWIAKSDVKKFADSIPLELLESTVQSYFPGQDPYFWKLLHSFVSPRIVTPEGKSEDRDLPGRRGIPIGIALTPVCQNLFLSDIDRDIAPLPNLFYGRYGDDLILAHCSKDFLLSTEAHFIARLADKGLELNADKKQLVVFRASQVSFSQDSVEYLGFRVSSSGKLFLPKRKIDLFKKEVRRLLKQGARSPSIRVEPKVKQVRLLHDQLMLLLEKKLAHPYAQALLVAFDDDEEMKKLDKWLAKLPLSLVYGGSQDRVFRYYPYRKLRREGIASLQHLRNLRMHRKSEATT